MKEVERKYLFNLTKELPSGGTVLEVGSFLGDSSTRAFSDGIKKFCPNGRLVCVDEFNQEFFENQKEFYKEVKKKIGNKTIYETFLDNMKDREYLLIKKDSLSASEDILNGSVDIIFIDANHEYEYVLKDINAWLPKLTPGGIMCGHDYGKSQFGVTEAVKEVFPAASNPVKSIWMVKC